ncbi:GLPGLI family protein [Robiginitalea sp.]|uniref:GLPGLI family protein n=1 Tax=Robiginitalea sp. TaxID=1902411 RepID=UPI003C7409F7
MRFEKSIILVLCILACYKGISQINNGEVVYRLDMENSFKKMFEQNKVKPNKGLYMYEAAAESLKKIKMRLAFGGDTSIFAPVKSALWEEEEIGPKIAIILAGSITYYSRLDSCAQILAREVEDKYILADNPIKDVEWNLENETKQIGDFTAYKASYEKEIPVGKITITAWYSPEIPVGLGPTDYVCGLPGLILELHDTMISYYAESITVNQNEDFTIHWPNSQNVLTTEEYQRMQKEYVSKKIPSRKN